MLIDLHMHEATFSPDSRLGLEEMVSLARKRGLDGICITDHDSMGLRKTAEAYGAKIGFPIFVGVEYLSREGDLVAFGLDHLPQRQLSAQEFVDYVHERGGVCFSAHPFRNNNRGLEKHLEVVRGLDGIEAFNASASYEANLKALEYCGRLGLQPLGASDCHIPRKVGRFATRFPRDVTDMEAFLRVFREGRCVPVGCWEDGYIDLLSEGRCRISKEEHRAISSGRAWRAPLRHREQAMAIGKP